MRRPRARPVLAITLSSILIISLFLLSQATQQSDRFGKYFSILLVLDLFGIALVLVAVIYKILQLLREQRKSVIGSGLTLRLIGGFMTLAILPLSAVYYVAVEFLNEGIDSWFDVRIEQALNDSLLLGRTSLEATRLDMIDNLKAASDEIRRSADPSSFSALETLRQRYGFQDLTLIASNGRVIASSSDSPLTLVPNIPAQPALGHLNPGEAQASLEPTGDGSLTLKGYAAIASRNLPQRNLTLYAIRALPARYAKLGKRVQEALGEYKRLLYLRAPLKTSFVLTLSLVALTTLLVGVWAAIISSQKLAAPLRELAKGTKALAAGDYSQRLSGGGSDEMGVLVSSFNDMTGQIQSAQQQVQKAHKETEQQRTYLETVLAYLSSGVLSLDRDLNLRTFNARAAQILGVDLNQFVGKPVGSISASHPCLEALTGCIEKAVGERLQEWSGEVELFNTQGHQSLLMRQSRIPDTGDRFSAGWVIVIDDVTELIQAQRDAAWGEVARRLAHEIKNPLTPIQLSAERLRRKYIGKLEENDSDTFDRSTRTIIDQVDAMKTMVNAFSSYAKPARVTPEEFDINELIRDVAALYNHESAATIKLELNAEPMPIYADKAAMRQVINNLLTNALAATENLDNGEVIIRSSLVDHLGADFVEVSVSDNGVGLDEAVIDHIFEPYVTTKEKGTGLGLAIVKKIIEEHSGQVVAENNANHGALMRFTLPLYSDTDDMIEADKIQ